MGMDFYLISRWRNGNRGKTTDLHFLEFGGVAL